MKKNFALFMTVLLIAASICACGDNTTINPNDDPNNNQGTVDSSNDNTTNQSGDISEVTEAYVRAYKAALASDFEYEIDGEGIKITEYRGSDAIVVIPNMIDGKPVTELKAYLFANESAVKGVYIPNSVKEIKTVFANNQNLQVVICEGVEKILKWNFMNCNSLHTVVLGDSLNELGESAFAGCSSLRSVYISKNVKSIDSGIASTVFFSSPNLTIVGESGSYIETFAQEYNIPFRAK